MTSEIVKDWFFQKFVQATGEYLKSRCLSLKALLLMDDAPSHPSAEMLQSDDSNMKYLFLAPNTTSLAQPMDQGVLECTKRRYRKKLLRKLLLADSEGGDSPELTVVEFWKKLNIKDVMFMVAKAWNDVPETTIQASWNKLLVTDNSEQHVEGPPGVHDTLESIAGCSDCDETNVKVLIEMDSKDQGYQIQDDDEIVRTVTEQNVEEDTSDTEFSEDNVSCPSHAEVKIC